MAFMYRRQSTRAQTGSQRQAWQSDVSVCLCCDSWSHYPLCYIMHQHHCLFPCCESVAVAVCAALTDSPLLFWWGFEFLSRWEEKPRGALWMSSPFLELIFAHLATRLKPLGVKCTITFWDSLSSSGEKQVKLMKERLYEAYSRHESLVREYSLT